MILLKLGGFFLITALFFFLSEKQNLTSWNVFDLLLFCMCLMVGSSILLETQPYFISILILAGLFVTRLFVKELTHLSALTKKKPTIVIKNGVLNFKELTRLSYSFEKLMSDLEKLGIQNIDEVGYAVLKGRKLLCIKK